MKKKFKVISVLLAMSLVSSLLAISMVSSNLVLAAGNSYGFILPLDGMSLK